LMILKLWLKNGNKIMGNLVFPSSSFPPAINTLKSCHKIPKQINILSVYEHLCINMISKLISTLNDKVMTQKTCQRSLQREIRKKKIKIALLLRDWCWICVFFALNETRSIFLKKSMFLKWENVSSKSTL
jgi:hypothetical protein